MKIDSIKIIGGFDKSGARKSVEEVVFRMGDIASIVGPTGYQLLLITERLESVTKKFSLTIISTLTEFSKKIYTEVTFDKNF